MKKTISALVGIALISALVWYGSTRRGAAPAATADDDTPASPYQLEAQDVLLLQMDANGQLQYEVEAAHIVLLPDNGGVLASNLTLHHDPPGTTPGGPQRWTLTAHEGRLPNEGRIVNLSGSVHARGIPAGDRNPILLVTEELRFDMDSQEATADGEVEFTRGNYRFRGPGLRVNVETGHMRLRSGNGKIPL